MKLLKRQVFVSKWCIKCFLTIITLNAIFAIFFKQTRISQPFTDNKSNSINCKRQEKEYWYIHNQANGLVNTAASSNDDKQLTEILPSWEDIIQIDGLPDSHSQQQLTEELTYSILWKKEQLNNSLNNHLQDPISDNEKKQIRSSSRYNLTIFTLNYNAGPVHAVRHLLEPLGIRFIDQSYSMYCHLTGTCSQNLQLLKKGKPFELTESFIDQFHQVYKYSNQFKDVDIFLCIDPPALCELFLPFNKSIFVLVGSRYERGHSSPVRWKMWNDKLKKIASIQHNIVATTNTYDAEYIRHFTQISAAVLQYPCQYISSTYSSPRKMQFLLFPIESLSFRKYFHRQISRYSKEGHYNISITSYEEEITGTTSSFQDIVNYQGMVLVPNDASSLLMTEIYRMNIPLFVPTIQLLSRWHISSHVISRRTLLSSRNPRNQGSFISAESVIPDPNNEQDMNSITHWLQFFDIYMNPYATLFSSIPDLLEKMEYFIKDRKYQRISKNMMEVNKYTRNKAIRNWKSILQNFIKH